MCLLRRSLVTWSPEFTSGDFIFNWVTAGSGVLEIGARQLNNWRLHEPPDLLPFCQPGVLSTRLYNNLMPRHYFRLPGRYNMHTYAITQLNHFRSIVGSFGREDITVMGYMMCSTTVRVPKRVTKGRWSAQQRWLTGVII